MRFVNFYRRFINEFFRIAEELTSLLKNAKKRKFKLKLIMFSKNRDSFRRLWNVFIKIFLLRHFDFSIKILLEMNALKFAISKILSQLIENQKWHLIVFWSRKIASSKRNYKVKKQKLLIIVNVCKKWRHYVEEFTHSIRVVIDHVNLWQFLIIKILSRRKTRWWKRLFDLTCRLNIDSKLKIRQMIRRDVEIAKKR